MFNTFTTVCRRAALLSAAALCSQFAMADGSVSLSSTTVGNTDNTSGWWSAFSDVVEVQDGKCLTFEFTNHTCQTNNFNNFIYVVSTANSTTIDGTDAFVRRADNFGWGTTSGTNYYDAANGWTDFFSKGLGVNGDFWAWFRPNMEGAAVKLSIVNQGGVAYTAFSIIAADGNKISNSYTQDFHATGSLYAFLTTELGHLTDLKASIADAPSFSNLAVASTAGTLWALEGETTVTMPQHFAQCTYAGSDGFTYVVPREAVSLSDANVSTGAFTATVNDVTVNGTVDIKAGCKAFGATDLSQGWWLLFTDDVQVKSGETYVSAQGFVRSSCTASWMFPAVILRNSARTEYAVCRIDNYGWGSGYDATKNTSDWNWTNFTSRLDGSAVKATVANNGDGTATIRIDVVDGAGVSHFQQYVVNLYVDVDKALTTDLYVSFTLEGSYVLYEAPSSETAISAPEAEGSDLKVVVRGGEVSVPGADSFTVVDLNGRRVAPQGLKPGLYVVCAAGCSAVVAVK